MFNLPKLDVTGPMLKVTLTMLGLFSFYYLTGILLSSYTRGWTFNTPFTRYVSFCSFLSLLFSCSISYIAIPQVNLSLLSFLLSTFNSDLQVCFFYAAPFSFLPEMLSMWERKHVALLFFLIFLLFHLSSHGHSRQIPLLFYHPSAEFWKTASLPPPLQEKAGFSSSGFTNLLL